MKKVFSFIAVFSLFITQGLIVGAEDLQEYEINTLEELEDFIKRAEKSSDDDDAERKYMFENTNPEILKVYTERFFDEVDEAIDGMLNEEFIADTSNPLNVKEDAQALPGGGVVTSLETDTREGGGIMTYSTVNKGFGDRRYTASYNISHFAYPDTKLRLVNRYKINKKGLTMTSTSTGGTGAVFPNTVSIKSNKITDKYAPKVGHDINGLAEYKLTIVGYNGVGLLTKDYSINSSIKLKALYSKSAKVSQTRSVDK